MPPVGQLSTVPPNVLVLFAVVANASADSVPVFCAKVNPTFPPESSGAKMFPTASSTIEPEVWPANRLTPPVVTGDGTVLDVEPEGIFQKFAVPDVFAVV